MSPELTTNQVYHDMRSILSNGSHSINVDCFKRADIINALCHLRYIDRAEHTYYDIARTVSAALKKARYNGLICVVLSDDCRWHNEYYFDSTSAAALALAPVPTKKVKTMKNENPASSYHYKMGVLKREARHLYDSISQLADDGNLGKTLKDYSSKELLEELQSRVEAKK